MGLRILGLRHETVKRSLLWSFHAIRDFARLLIYSKVAGTRAAQMKRARLIFSVLILIVPIAFLALQAKPGPASVEDETKDFEQRANAAYEANDLAKYFSLYAADFSQFLPEGGQTSHSTAKIGLLTSGKDIACKKWRSPTCTSKLGPTRTRPWRATFCVCGPN